MQGKRTVVQLRDGTKEYRYYHCAISSAGSNHLRADCRCSALSIHADVINERVYQAVKAHVLDEAVLAAAYAESRERQAARQGEADAALAVARRNVAGLNAAIDRLVLAISEVGHSRSILDKLTELEHERDREQLQVIDLEMQATRPLPDLDIGALVREGLAIIDGGDFRKKQLLLRSFIREIRAEETDGELVGEIDLLMPGGEGMTFSI
ncbi:MAG: zinc ribbon domain-containing protein [Syntrophaceae bacterium]